MRSINRIELPTPFVLNKVNCYYIHDSVPTLIDAGVGTDEAFKVLSAGITECGGSGEATKRIILTHAHADHIGLLSRIVNLSKAEVFIHRLDAKKMINPSVEETAHLMESYKVFFLESGVSEELTHETLAHVFARLKKYFIPFGEVKALSGGETISFDEFDLQVIHTPGHSPGSICLFVKDEGSLFSGDTLLGKISSNPVFEVNPSGENTRYRSLETYKKTLSFLAELPIKTVLPGHGMPFEHHSRRIDELLKHHEERGEQIVKIIEGLNHSGAASHRISRFIIMQKMFGDLVDWNIFLGLSEITGHLEVLEAEGKVFSDFRGGHILYTV